MAADTLTTDSFICSGDYYSISSPSLWIIFFFLVSCDEEVIYKVVGDVFLCIAGKISSF